MTDECISTTTTTRRTTTIEYITKATLKMNTTAATRNATTDSTFRRSCTDDDYDEIGDRPDALGMGIMGGEDPSAGNKTANGVLQSHQTNGKVASFEIASIARMPTERNAMEYNMNHKRRGIALIFNHEYYDIPSLEPRKGTNVDCEKLKMALKNLDFDVNIYKDCKLRDLYKHIESAASQDHSDNDCIAVAILTHGEHGYLYAKDVMYKLENIWHYFTAHECPTLAGKPKLFFIQACRGDRLDPGIKLQKTETDGETFSEMTYRIPVHADFLISYSTIPGFYSWRNTTDGSWYIQSLVEELNRNGKKYDMLTLLTFVSQRVAVGFESCVPSRPIMDQQKQIPCLTSMLTRILRFNEKSSNKTT